MFKWLIKQLKDKKGFTLVEVIIVIAILGILSIIAVPRLRLLQDESKIKADSVTAAQIVNLARVQEINRNDGKVTHNTTETEANWDVSFMEWPQPQSGEEFILSGGLDNEYVVKWTPNKGAQKYQIEQTVTEGHPFIVNTK